MPSLLNLNPPAGPGGGGDEDEPIPAPSPINTPFVSRLTGISPEAFSAGAAGLGLAGVLLARSPAGRQALSKFWTKAKMPQELPVTTARPKSPVISETERTSVQVGEHVRDLFNKPWVGEFTYTKNPKPGTLTGTRDPNVFKQAEQAQVDEWRRLVAGGTRPDVAHRDVISRVGPDFVREAQAYRMTRIPDEEWAKKYLGLTDLPLTPGPYLPRRVAEGSRDVISIRGNEGGLFGDLRTSISGFQKERTYGTMLEGEKAGMKYQDPRLSWLQREVLGLRMVETAKYIQRLEGSVIFRTERDLLAKFPGAKPIKLEGLPGRAQWYVPSREEAQFIRDNVISPKYGYLGSLKSFADQIARNPNLLNPAPHFIKNMLYKYGLSGGGPRVFNHMKEFWSGSHPDVARFNRIMPFDTSGVTGEETIARTIAGLKRDEGPIGALKFYFSKLGGLNAWSSRMIFGKLDPALRYARWKDYVAKGMDEVEAANHTHVDLIRYGTRSDTVDFWKNIPGNFFVPWRLGTVTSVHKQLMDHPLRAAAFIGAVDYLREMRYRKTGRWTHLPIDYIESPIASILQARTGEDTAKSLIGATLGTLLLGPGGGFAGAQIADSLRFASGNPVEWQRLGNMFWGLSQIYNVPVEGAKVVKAMNAGQTDEAIRHAQNLLATLAIAEHSALNYRPRRLLAALPEVLPGMRKSDEVRAAERMQDAKSAAIDRMNLRKQLRKDFTIEKRIESIYHPEVK